MNYLISSVAESIQTSGVTSSCSEGRRTFFHDSFERLVHVTFAFSFMELADSCHHLFGASLVPLSAICLRELEYWRCFRRVEFHGFLKLFDGTIQVAPTKQQFSQARSGMNKPWVHTDRSLECSDCFVFCLAAGRRTQPYKGFSEQVL